MIILATGRLSVLLGFEEEELNYRPGTMALFTAFKLICESQLLPHLDVFRNERVSARRLACGSLTVEPISSGGPWGSMDAKKKINK